MLSHRRSDVTTVLYVDDDPVVGARRGRALERERARFDVQVVRDRNDALEQVDERPVDCLVGPLEDRALLESVRATDPALPVVLVGEPDTAVALNRALEGGATDVVYRTDDTWLDLLTVRIERAAEEYHRRLEFERYQLMLDSVPDGVYALDRDLHYQYVNQAMTDLLGYPAEKLEGSDISLVNDDSGIERANEARLRALERDDRRGVAYNDHITADGERIPCEVLFRAIVDDDEFQGTVGVLRDISDRLERERELKRQNDRLNEFTSIVSHDLRNPLLIALGNLELAEETGDEAAIEEATLALERMYDLIEDLLTLARQGRVIDDRERLDLASLVDTALLTVGTDDVTVDVDGLESVTVSGDETRLGELLENLFRNTVEHSSTSHALDDEGDGDTVTIWVGPLEDEPGFYVEDDGPGIPESERDRVFDPGYTTREGGTGFGLRIVEEIVDAHGWSIELREGRTGGARFEITYD
ncbi:hybrid sensor histidine kinase/response regulator [Natronobiforma cellulositropha]|uniref:hybrid sensor histidine kinase/response regulator n=1 Tax=Natronobiforma cellulositropha TaxID=1679076 RepID=UPI0021D5D4EE|nr:ATP-binding protein [Natronobiforma cellulositropha]